jgi:hypothetical protein
LKSFGEGLIEGFINLNKIGAIFRETAAIELECFIPRDLHNL